LVLVLDPGKVDIETDLQPRLSMEDVSEMTLMELEERLYHRLIIQFSDVQCIFIDSGKRENVKLPADLFRWALSMVGWAFGNLRQFASQLYSSL